MDWKKYVRIASIVLLSYLLYSAGMQPIYVAIFGIFTALLIFTKDIFYKKIDEFVNERFAFIAKLPAWAKKILIVLIFVLIYAIFKQAIFSSLKMAGINMEQMILERFNISKR